MTFASLVRTEPELNTNSSEKIIRLFNADKINS